MIRLAHISDIHLSTKELEWQFRDYLNKRFAGWINHRWLGRRFRFRHSEMVLQSLFAELPERNLDHVIFSGDATALGFESELRLAAGIMGVDNEDAIPGIAVPGNHDYATKPAAASGLFEKVFAPWQQGERIDDFPYPFAQRVGEVWLIGVNSSSGNRWAWDATGRVGSEQAERLRQLLANLDSGPRIIVTHYPVCLKSGRNESIFRKLRDAKQIVEVVSQGDASLWLHGHRHHGYFLPESDKVPFPIICAGSTTQTKIWSYCEYEIEGNQVKALRRVFNLKAERFEDSETFAVELAGVVV